MIHPNADLEHRIDKINQYSLITYLKVLGYTPVYESQEFMIFHFPLDNIDRSTLVVNTFTNRFRLTIEIDHGGIVDLASMIFRPKPEDILADIAPYKLDQFISAEAGKNTTLL